MYSNNVLPANYLLLERIRNNKVTLTATKGSLLDNINNSLIADSDLSFVINEANTDPTSKVATDISTKIIETLSLNRNIYTGQCTHDEFMEAIVASLAPRIREELNVARTSILPNVIHLLDTVKKEISSYVHTSTIASKFEFVDSVVDMIGESNIQYINEILQSPEKTQLVQWAYRVPFNRDILSPETTVNKLLDANAANSEVVEFLKQVDLDDVEKAIEAITGVSNSSFLYETNTLKVNLVAFLILKWLTQSDYISAPGISPTDYVRHVRGMLYELATKFTSIINANTVNNTNELLVTGKVNDVYLINKQVYRKYIKEHQGNVDIITAALSTDVIKNKHHITIKDIVENTAQLNVAYQRLLELDQHAKLNTVSSQLARMSKAVFKMQLVEAAKDQPEELKLLDSRLSAFSSVIDAQRRIRNEDLDRLLIDAYCFAMCPQSAAVDIIKAIACSNNGNEDARACATAAVVEVLVKWLVSQVTIIRK